MHSIFTLLLRKENMWEGATCAVFLLSRMIAGGKMQDYVCQFLTSWAALHETLASLLDMSNWNGRGD